MKDPKKNKKYPGYPTHPQSEDIFKQEEEVHIDANEGKLVRDENQGKDKEGEFPRNLPPLDENNNSEDDDWNEENFDENYTGEDLDVPGAELDDAMENNGSEDEENNYYSLGSDRKDQ